MRYKEIPLSREGDELLIDIFDHLDLSEAEMMSFCQIRCSLNAMFLSVIVTANGHNLESFAISKEKEAKVKSTYDFPKECPTDLDWKVWLDFWDS